MLNIIEILNFPSPPGLAESLAWLHHANMYTQIQHLNNLQKAFGFYRHHNHPSFSELWLVVLSRLQCMLVKSVAHMTGLTSHAQYNGFDNGLRPLHLGSTMIYPYKGYPLGHFKWASYPTAGAIEALVYTYQTRSLSDHLNKGTWPHHSKGSTIGRLREVGRMPCDNNWIVSLQVEPEAE